MSTAVAMGWRPVYDAGETVEQVAARQRQAFAAFELAWREGRVSIKLKGYYDQVVRDVGANAYAWWTEERWAQAFGVSASTIKRVLAALTKAGLIRRERQFGASSHTFLTSYDRHTNGERGADACSTDNHYLAQPLSTLPLSQHDIMKHEEEDELAPTSEQNPEVPHEEETTSDYRQHSGSFFGGKSEPTIGSLLRRDHVKTRHLTVGAAGEHSPAAEADPLTRQVLEREGVVDFILAPQLTLHAAGELQAVSQYLDTQHTVRDRPRLFTWLATHGFGRQLLAGRATPDARRTRTRGPAQPRPPAAVPLTPPPARPPTTHQALWTAVCDQLRSDGAIGDVTVWLPDTVLLDLTDTAAIVGTPNVFVRDAVEARAPLVATALERQLGKAVAVLAVVDGCA